MSYVQWPQKNIILPQLRRKDGSGGITMANGPVMYIVKWTGVLGIYGEKILFSQRQVDTYLRQMKNAIKSYSVEKVYK
jgi:hypothetical protein